MVIKLGGQDRDTCMGLTPNEAEMIAKVLVENVDLFVWIAAYMSGMNQVVVLHKLAIHQEVRPIAQKKRKENWGTRREK